MKPEVIARHLRDAAWQTAHGNPKGALALYRKVFKAGHSDLEAFNRYRALHGRTCGRDLPHEEVFDFIYSTGYWGLNEGGTAGSSGWGSGEAASRPYRDFLTAFLAERGIKSVVEVGCGDWQIGRLIDWSGIDYVGFDVSSVIVRSLDAFVRPNVRFVLGDARAVELPRADLLLVKDVFQHWSNADILGFLPQLPRFTFALITNGTSLDPEAPLNQDINAGDYRAIDLSRPPFLVHGSVVLTTEVTGRTDRVVLREWKRTFLVENGGA